MTADFPGSASAPLSQSDERTWAMFAHLGILLNLVTAFLGVAVPIVIYFIYKDRSRYVAYQAMQAFVFQLVAWVGAGILAGVMFFLGGILSIILIGLLCFPIAFALLLVPLVALGYGIYGGLKCNEGENFRYWLIGDWVSQSFVPAP